MPVARVRPAREYDDVGIRCLDKTTGGRRCKRTTKHLSGLCPTHLKPYDDTQIRRLMRRRINLTPHPREGKRCSEWTQKENRCTRKATHEDLCTQHCMKDEYAYPATLVQHAG
ncbi:uncharacterized protein LOC121405688 [Lytechinus variegatus]|uniref:uncharacterized protein LOC121405688 n=1 Tax=Lytechinus variegatus TaxID=7654 RepID=UPI001BB23EFB|nr:uncharacterized protein LOC121405688 [Lytechinus variegatus]